MNKKIEEIKELLSSMLKKLETIQIYIEMQGIKLKAYIENGDIEPNLGEIWLGIHKSTKTSLELLRNEIEEAYQIMLIISSKSHKA